MGRLDSLHVFGVGTAVEGLKGFCAAEMGRKGEGVMHLNEVLPPPRLPPAVGGSASRAPPVGLTKPGQYVHG